MGYDGKGQTVIRDATGLAEAWKNVGGVLSSSSKYVSFQNELSVIGVRDSDGREVFYPPSEPSPPKECCADRSLPLHAQRRRSPH